MKGAIPLILSGLMLAACPSSLRAGSVTFAELEGVLKSNPRLHDFVEAISFEENGTGTRLGRYFRGAHGGRVGPYVFNGRGRSGTGPFDVKVTLVTEWYLEDGQGNVYKGDPPTPPEDDRPLEIREKLVSIEISDSVSPPEEAEAKKRNGTTETDDGMNRGEEGGSGSSPSAGGAEGLAGTFAEGDYLYAGEYFCDNYMLRLKAGQELEATLHSEGMWPEILSKREQWFGPSGPRSAAVAAGEPAVIRYEPQADGVLILLVTNKNKKTEGSYRLEVSINGKSLAFPDPLPEGQTDKKIVPLN